MLLVWFPDNMQAITNHGLHGCNVIKSNNVTIATGGYGNSLAFNGSNSYLTMNLPLGSMNSELTITFHIWMNNGNTTGTVISCRKTTGAGLSIFKLSGNKWRLDNGNDSNSATYQTEFTDYTVPNKATHHVAIVQTPTQKKLYIDGVLVQTVNSAPQTGNTAQYLLIGGSASSDTQTPTSNWLNGNLNDFRIYNEVLSDQTIARLARKTTATIHKNKQLELWMPLNNNLNSYGTKKITATGTAITYANAKTGKNATFNGSTSVINTDFNWTPTTGWSIAAWVKHTVDTPNGTIVRANTGQSPIFDFNGTNGAVRCLYYKSNSDLNRLNTTYIPEKNIWHHYVALWDGSKIKFYVDGVLNATQDNCTEVPYNGTGTMNIGYYNYSGHMFTGQIADVRLYNYALTSSEIYELTLARVGHYLLNGLADNTNYVAQTTKTECNACNGDRIHHKDNINVVYTTLKTAGSPRYQNCYNFIPSGARYIHLGTSYSTLADQKTYLCWVYATNYANAFSSTNQCGLLSSVESGGDGWITSGSGTSRKLRCYSYALGNCDIDCTTELTPGWHLLAHVQDGFKTTIYIDGVLLRSGTAKTSKTALSTKANNLYLCAESSGTQVSANYAKMKVSNLEIFATALTADQILERYNKAHIPTT